MAATFSFDYTEYPGIQASGRQQNKQTQESRTLPLTAYSLQTIYNRDYYYANASVTLI